MERPVIALSIALTFALLLVNFGTLADKPASLRVYTPADYEATYIVEKYGTQIARLNYRLLHESDNIVFTTRAEVIGFAALFRNDSAEERSELSNTSPPRLLSYNYQQRGSDKNRNTRLAVNWHDNHANIQGNYAGKDFTLSADNSVWDPLSVQFALMQDMVAGTPPFDYQVIHHGKLKHYTFDQQQDDSLEIDEVFYDAVVLQRKHDNRLTRFWLAKDYQFIPLQIENYRNGELETRILLDSINIHE